MIPLRPEDGLERATLANWMAAPHSRWSFRNISALIRTAPIPGAPEPLVLEDRRVGLADLDADARARGAESRDLAGVLERLEVDGVIVLAGRAAVFEHYADHVSPADRHILFSVSKSITGLLAGALAGAGRLDLEAPVTDYVPEVGASGFARASVRHLLDMSVSIDFIEDYEPDADFVTYGAAGGWGPEPAEVDLRSFLAGVRPRAQHGQRFDYLSPCTDLLGWVCERAAGIPYTDAVSSYVWIPMGAEEPATVTVDDLGLARAAGGISATLRDLARVGRLVLEGGAGSVPRWFLDDLSAGSTAELWASGGFTDLFPHGAYRSCWYQPRVGEPALCAIGIHGQYIYLDPRRDAVVAIVSSRATAADDPADLAALALADQLVAALTSP